MGQTDAVPTNGLRLLVICDTTKFNCFGPQFLGFLIAACVHLLIGFSGNGFAGLRPKRELEQDNKNKQHSLHCFRDAGEGKVFDYH